MRVYDEMNVGLLRPDGERHEYPWEYPLGKAARAYRMIIRDPVDVGTELRHSLLSVRAYGQVARPLSA